MFGCVFVLGFWRLLHVFLFFVFLWQLKKKKILIGYERKRRSNKKKRFNCCGIWIVLMINSRCWCFFWFLLFNAWCCLASIRFFFFFYNSCVGWWKTFYCDVRNFEYTNLTKMLPSGINSKVSKSNYILVTIERIEAIMFVLLFSVMCCCFFVILMKRPFLW